MNRETHLPAGSSSLRRRSNRFRSRSLEVAAVGLAASALPGTASAVIIYDSSVGTSSGTTFSIDGTISGEIDLVASMAMGGTDLIFEAPAGMGMNPGSTLQLSVFSSGGMNATDFLTLYNPGDTVDGSLNFASEAFMVDSPVINPVWAPGTTGYAGFVFDTGSGPLYGWLQVEFDISGTDFTVLQFAYEDSGAPIGVAISPELGTGVLVGLGLVGLSVLFRKRRRASPSAGTN